MNSTIFNFLAKGVSVAQLHLGANLEKAPAQVHPRADLEKNLVQPPLIHTTAPSLIRAKASPHVRTMASAHVPTMAPPHVRTTAPSLIRTMASPLINTPLQRGEACRRDLRNRFNGFPLPTKTVETVFPVAKPVITPLKRGVNETSR